MLFVKALDVSITKHCKGDAQQVKGYVGITCVSPVCEATQNSELLNINKALLSVYRTVRPMI